MNIENIKIYEDDKVLITELKVTTNNIVEVTFIKLDKETNTSFSIDDITTYTDVK